MAEAGALVRALGDCPLFAGLDEEALLACAKVAREQTLSPGQVLFQRGDPGDRLYVVSRGRLRIAVNSSEGRELSVRFAAPGDALGEIAVVDGGARTADVTAVNAAQVVGIAAADFNRLWAEHPALGRAVMRALCERVRDTTEQLETIALYPVEIRLARFLLLTIGDQRPEPGKRLPVDLGLSQGELAQLLGASSPRSMSPSASSSRRARSGARRTASSARPTSWSRSRPATKADGGQTMTSVAPRRPAAADNQLAITFLYYRDLPAAMRFYEEVLGLTLAIDQGWSKIYRITASGYVGLVDETRGSHRAHPVKPVQLCIRVADVAAWHAWVASQGVASLGPLRTNAELGISVFVFDDPEGYQIEIQSVAA